PPARCSPLSLRGTFPVRCGFCPGCGNSFSASESSPPSDFCRAPCWRQARGTFSQAWPVLHWRAIERSLPGPWPFLTERGSFWLRRFCSSPRGRRKMKTKAQSGRHDRGNEGRFAYEGLDRVIHERARLSILTSLITNPKGVSFGDLKQLCSLTDGNLSRHLRVLEKAKMVEIVKGTDRNRPLTICRITPAGRKRYLEYLATLEQVVRDAEKGSKDVPATGLLR